MTISDYSLIKRTTVLGYSLIFNGNILVSGKEEISTIFFLGGGEYVLVWSSESEPGFFPKTCVLYHLTRIYIKLSSGTASSIKLRSKMNFPHLSLYGLYIIYLGCVL